MLPVLYRGFVALKKNGTGMQKRYETGIHETPPIIPLVTWPNFLSQVTQEKNFLKPSGNPARLSSFCLTGALSLSKGLGLKLVLSSPKNLRNWTTRDHLLIDLSITSHIGKKFDRIFNRMKKKQIFFHFSIRYHGHGSSSLLIRRVCHHVGCRNVVSSADQITLQKKCFSLDETYQ